MLLNFFVTALSSEYYVEKGQNFSFMLPVRRNFNSSFKVPGSTSPNNVTNSSYWKFTGAYSNPASYAIIEEFNVTIFVINASFNDGGSYDFGNETATLSVCGMLNFFCISIFNNCKF